MSELKPCPFCGGAVEGEASVCDYIVLCRACGVKMRRNSEHRNAAVASWNRRAPSPAYRALVEAVRSIPLVVQSGELRAALAAAEKEVAR